MRTLWDVKRLKDGIILFILHGDEVLEIVITEEEMRQIITKWTVPDFVIRAGNFNLVDEAKRGS